MNLRIVNRAWRLLLAAGLMGWILARVPFDDLRGAAATGLAGWWPWWPAGALLTLAGLLAGALRWRGLLRAQGGAWPLPRVLRYYFIGQFFNSFFLGACGGDVSRVWMAARGAGDKRGATVSTVLVDRAAGLLVFVACGACMTALRWPHLASAGAGQALALAAGLLAAGLLGILVMGLLPPPPTGPASRLPGFPRLSRLLRQLHLLVDFYRTRPRLLARSLAWSVVNLVCMTVACHAFGISLGIDMALADTFAVFPLVSVFAAIPLTPGSLGVRENLFAHLYAGAGVPAHLAVMLSLLIYLDGLLWSLCGGLLLLQSDKWASLPPGNGVA